LLLAVLEAHSPDRARFGIEDLVELSTPLDEAGNAQGIPISVSRQPARWRSAR